MKPGIFVLSAYVGLIAFAQVSGLEIRNSSGLRLTVDADDTDPALDFCMPGRADQRTAKILLPEHITVRAHGESDAKHLYLYRPGRRGNSPKWTKTADALEYASDFEGIHVVARASLSEDGIVFRYEFTNHSATDFDMVTAITDPRFERVFHDPKLERTYVHHPDGFDLLASETPERMTMPERQWFPVRYLASWTAAVPADRVQRRDDGITYRYKSRRVDLPMIATLSDDRQWIAASFARNPGNVWSNPELTCHHVDPEIALPHNTSASYEVKILIFRGSLGDALRKVTAQRPLLR